MKIRYTLTIILATLIAAIGITAIVGTEIIRDNNFEVINREIPKTEAALEMEINVNEMITDLLKILDQKGGIEKFDKDTNDFLEFNKIYKKLIRTDEERIAIKKLDLAFSDYVDTSRSLISTHSKQVDKIQERRDLLNLSIEEILDEKLQQPTNFDVASINKKFQALNEMEINIHELISASRGYLLKPDAFLKDRITDSIGDYRFFENQYSQSSLTQKELEYFETLKLNFNTAEILTKEIIDLEDSQIELRFRLNELSIKIDHILDEEIQRISKEKLLEDDQLSIETIDNLLIILSVLFIITLSTGFVYSTRLGKRLAKIVKVTNAITGGNLDVSISAKANDEIGDLARSMKTMAQKLKQGNLQQEQFAAMITHELKTPLVPIKGYCEMLLNPKFGELSKDQKDAVEEILQNASQLQELIQNVLSAQKLSVEGMKYSYEDIDVDKFIERIFKTLAPYMTDKKISFTKSIQKGMKMRADKSKLVEVFTNIVQNSVDFVPDTDGKITIEGKLKDKQIQFSIIDNGIGMPKDKQTKLFQKFYQVDTSHTRKHGGSGLGLSICKGYIEDMHGNIWIESEEGKGTTIFFTLPMVN